MLSSDPPSQYCIDRNQARRSCDLPGMYFRIFGSRRSIDICFSPDEAEGALVPRSFFKSAIAPEAGCAMSRSPIRVSLTICGSAIMPTKASTWARAAVSSGRMAVMCSSMNNRFATIRSAPRIAALARVSAAGVSAHSAAARTVTRRPGKSRRSRGSARAAGPAAWASSVTMTTL